MGRTLCQYWTRHFSLSVKPLDPIWVRRLTRQKSIFKNCSIVDTIGTESSVISIILIDLLRTKYWYGYHFDQEKILNNPSSFTVKWSASKWCQKYSIIFNLITVYQPKHGQVEPNKTLICNKTAYQGKYSLFQYSLSVDLKSLWKFSVCLQFYRIIGEKSIISNLFKKITDKIMCLTWTSRKLRRQKNELTRKGTLSPSMRLLPLGTRTELLGYSVGVFTNEIESYS